MYFRIMDQNEYNRINAVINSVINGMTPVERAYHDVKVGLHFMSLLNDYQWDRSVFNIPIDQMKSLQSTGYTKENFECRIPIWLDSWSNFSLASATVEQKARFEDEVNELRYAMILHMPDHPANARSIRWVMSIFEEERKCFHYDQIE